MTLPPYMMNRADLQDLESIVVLALAQKFTPSPRLTCGFLAETTLVDPFKADLPIMCPLEDTPNAEMMSSNKRALAPREAADIIDAALGDFSLVTSPPIPKPPAKKARIARRSKKATHRSASCTLPTADDPIDDSFCKSLYSKRDEGKINPAHIVIRDKVLEVRRTLTGRVCFQCAYCKHVPRSKRAKLSTLAPQNIDNLYRAMVRFMMNHVKACDHVPQRIKDLNPKDSRVANESGTRKYWTKSAIKLGLRNGDDGKSIIYCGPTGI